jgi:hypothetical protein
VRLDRRLTVAIADPRLATTTEPSPEAKLASGRLDLRARLLSAPRADEPDRPIADRD